MIEWRSHPNYGPVAETKAFSLHRDAAVVPLTFSRAKIIVGNSSMPFYDDMW